MNAHLEPGYGVSCSALRQILPSGQVGIAAKNSTAARKEFSQ